MSASLPRLERLVVPDVLRGIAIVAMLIAHAAPTWTSRPRPIAFVTANINDLASPLFALVMGMSAQLLLARVPAGRGRATLQQGLRGLVLIALGVWMATWGTWVVVVLAFLGVLLIVGAPLLLLGTRALAAVCVVVVLVSDPLNAWARTLPVITSSPWSDLAQWVALGSSYRLTNLLPFFLLGALLIRHGIRRDGVLWAMLAIAPVAYLVRPLGERLAGWPEGVSGSFPDTLHDVGLVFLTYVAVVLLAEARAVPVRRVVRAVFAFLGATGQVALSLYLLHVGVLWLWGVLGAHRHPDDPLLLAMVVVMPLLAGWLWWRLVGTGPVEWLLGAVTGRRKRLFVGRRG